MKVGQKVKLKETSVFAMEIDRHNPTDKIGSYIVTNCSEFSKNNFELAPIMN